MSLPPESGQHDKPAKPGAPPSVTADALDAHRSPSNSAIVLAGYRPTEIPSAPKATVTDGGIEIQPTKPRAPGQGPEVTDTKGVTPERPAGAPEPGKPDPNFEITIPKNGGPYQALEAWNKKQPADKRLSQKELMTEARAIRDAAFQNRDSKYFKQGETLSMRPETIEALKARGKSPDAPGTDVPPERPPGPATEKLEPKPGDTSTSTTDQDGVKTTTNLKEGKPVSSDSESPDKTKQHTDFNPDQSIKSQKTTRPDGSVETVTNDQNGKFQSRTRETTDPKTGEKVTTTDDAAGKHTVDKVRADNSRTLTETTKEGTRTSEFNNKDDKTPQFSTLTRPDSTVAESTSVAKDGTVSKFTFDDKGTTATSKDVTKPDGSRRLEEYSSNGQSTVTQWDKKDQPNPSYQEIIHKDAEGANHVDQTKMWDAKGDTTTRTYDAEGKIASIYKDNISAGTKDLTTFTPDGSTQKQWSKDGSIVTKFDKEQKPTSIDITNKNGRQLTETENGTVTKTEWDAQNNKRFESIDKGDGNKEERLWYPGNKPQRERIEKTTDGKTSLEERNWDENGQKRFEHTKGEDGVEVTSNWYANGKPESTETNRPDGSSEYHEMYDNGNKRTDEVIGPDTNKTKEVHEFYKSGAPKRDSISRPDNSSEDTTHYENGHLRSESIVKADKSTIDRQFDENGTKRSEQTFTPSAEDGSTNLKTSSHFDASGTETRSTRDFWKDGSHETHTKDKAPPTQANIDDATKKFTDALASATDEASVKAAAKALEQSLDGAKPEDAQKAVNEAMKKAKLDEKYDVSLRDDGRLSLNRWENIGGAKPVATTEFSSPPETPSTGKLYEGQVNDAISQFVAKIDPSKTLTETTENPDFKKDFSTMINQLSAAGITSSEMAQKIQAALKDKHIWNLTATSATTGSEGQASVSLDYQPQHKSQAAELRL